MSSQDDTARANAAWEALLIAHSVLIKHFDMDHVWTDVSMHEYDVLYTLRRHDAPMRMRSLSESVLLSQPGLSRLVDRLVKRGLVQRHRATQDGRGILVELTPEGRIVQRKTAKAHDRSVADVVTRALNDAEQEQLRTLCGKLSGVITR